MQPSTRFAYFIAYLSISITASKTAPISLQQTQYHGTITTLNNKNIDASNISVASKRNCIPVYKAPCDTDTLLTCLSYNPKNYKTRLSLSEVKEIEIPYPYATWVYRWPKCKGKDNYLLIKVVWKDEKRHATHYLIEPKRRLNGLFQKKESTAVSSIPFSGFKKCTVNPMPR